VGALEHINLGAGIGANGFSATAELQTVFALTSARGTQENATVSLRYQDQVSPYVSVSTPLQDELHSGMFAVSAGVTIPF